MGVFFFVPLSLPPASNAPGVWFLYARRACTRATVRHHKTRGGQTTEPKKSTVSVLGEEYTIHYLNPEDDATLNHCQGYTDESTREIVVRRDLADSDDPMNVSDWSAIRKATTRHEIVHAFFFESGLGCESDYAQNEELVDWIARQGPKLYRAWAEAGAL